MSAVGIWEKDEGVFSHVFEALHGRGHVPYTLLRAGHPAELAGILLDLLVIAPGALGWAGAGALGCKMVLLPGSAGPLARAFQVGCAVSYGTSPKDTITISSVEGRQLCVAVQRELVTVGGGVVEQQELVLTLPASLSPPFFLAAVGAQLLLDVPAENVQ